MANYKLTYFSAPGLGEPIRYLLAYGGQDFEDIRFVPQEWPKIKPTTPFGKVPVLEFDGKKAIQTRAICRYLAKKFNLLGADDWENLQIDSLVDTVEDIRSEYVAYYLEADPVRKAKLETSVKASFPYYLERFEALVKENGGYFVNGKLTWADIYFASHMKVMCDRFIGESVYAGYPNLVAVHEKVHAIPKIADYLAKRPPFAM